MAAFFHVGSPQQMMINKPSMIISANPQEPTCQGKSSITSCSNRIKNLDNLNSYENLDGYIKLKIKGMVLRNQILRQCTDLARSN